MVTLIDELINNLPITSPAVLPNTNNKITNNNKTQRRLQQSTIENYLNRSRTSTKLQLNRREDSSSRTTPITPTEKITRRVTLLTRETHTNIIKNNSNNIANKALSEITDTPSVAMQKNKTEVMNNNQKITSQANPIPGTTTQTKNNVNKP